MYLIIKESVNSEIYLNFINQNKEYLKNKNLVQDNVRIHHSKKVKDFCKVNNINLIYNPQYSPEFNPIKLIFNQPETKFKKLDHKDIKYDINLFLRTIINEDINNFFNHSLKFINKYK